MSTDTNPLINNSLKDFNINVFDTKNKKLEKNDYLEDISKIVSQLKDQKLISTNKKKNNIRITLLDEHRYQIKIGNSQFYVALADKSQTAESESLILIKEKIVENRFFKVFTKFFSSIKHLFFDKEKFPPKDQRLPSEIVRHDYRLFRKSLEKGRSLLPETRTDTLVKTLDQTIAHARQIENALESKNPAQALRDLSQEWSSYIIDNVKNNGDEFAFTTGYINDEGVLQPIMVRVYKENDELLLDIYCDSPDAGKKVAPLQTRKIHLDPQEQFINPNERTNFLANFVTMLAQTDPGKGLPKFAKEDKTFGELVETEKAALKDATGVSLSIVEEKSPQKKVAFELLMEKVDNFQSDGTKVFGPYSLDTGAGVGFEEEAIGNEQQQPPANLITASKTNAQRITKWFDSLLDKKDSKLTPFEKATLLYTLTEQSVKNQLSQINNKMAPEKQLQIYRDCLVQINHTNKKLAPAIVGDEKATILAPPGLQKLQKQCEVKMGEIRKQIRKNSVEGNVAALKTPKKAEFPITLSEVTMGVQTTPGIPAPSVVDPALQTQWDTDFKTFQTNIKAIEDPAYQKALAKQKIVSVLDSTIARLEKAAPNDKLEKAKALKNNLNQLLEEGKIQEISEQILALVDDDALKDFFIKLKVDKPQRGQTQKKTEIFNLDAFDTTFYSIDDHAASFKETATRLVISPLLLPTLHTSEFGGLLRMLDEQLTLSDEHMPILELFRASYALSHFVTPAQQKAYTESQMALDYERSITTSVDQFLQARFGKKKTLAEISQNDPQLREDCRQLLKMSIENKDNPSEATTEKLKTEEERLEQRIVNIIAPPLQSTKKPMDYFNPNMLEPSDDEFATVAYEYLNETFQAYNVKMGGSQLTFFNILSKKDETLKNDCIEFLKQSLANRKNPSEETAKKLTEAEQSLNKRIANIVSAAPEGSHNLSFFILPSKLHAPAVELLESAFEREVPEDQEEVQYPADVSASQIVQNVADLSTQTAEIFNGASAHQDKVGMKQGYENALKLLKALPPMGSESTLNIASPWSLLTKEERAQAIEALDKLEKVVWEYHMRMGITEAQADVPLIQIKAQVIRLGLLRNEIKELKSDIQKRLSAGLHSENPEEVQKIKNALVAVQMLNPNDPIPDVLELDFSKLSPTSLELFITECKDIEILKDLPVDTLILDRYTLPLGEYNFNLTQDLTNLGSDSVQAQHDLTTSFNFLVQDFHYGKGDAVTAPNHQDYRIYRSSKLPQLNARLKDNKWLDGMIRGHLYYKSAYDPNFVLKSSEVAIPPLQNNPDTFLTEEVLNIRVGENPSIINSQGQSIAEIIPSGTKLAEERKPFLPTMYWIANALNPSLVDKRTLGTHDAWETYAEEMSLKAPSPLPPDALTALFSIRQVIGDRDRSTATLYSPTVLANALDYICSPDNLSALGHDFVQQYLLETMFGPFIAQHGLTEQVDHIIHSMDELEKNFSFCMENGRVMEAGFIFTVMEKLSVQVEFALKDIETQGISGSVYTQLPMWKGRNFTAHGVHQILSRDHGYYRYNAFDTVIDKMKPDEISAPFLNHLTSLKSLKNKLDSQLKGVSTTMIELYKEGYFKITSQTNAWNVDGYPTTAKKTIYLNVVEQYQQYFAKREDFNEALEALNMGDGFPNDISIMISAWKTLSDPHHPTYNSLRNQKALRWLEGTLKPYLQENIQEQPVQEALTQSYLRLNPYANAEDARQLPPWEFTPPHSYTSKDHLHRDITLDFSRTPAVYLKGVAVEDIQPITQKLPYRLLQRNEVKQALHSPDIEVLSYTTGNNTIHKWSYEGQNFEILEQDTGEPDSLLRISRTVDGETYVFQALNTSQLNQETITNKILALNGVWSTSNDKHKVFTAGMKKPTVENSYDLVQNAEKTTARLQCPGTNMSVGATSLKKMAQPLLFAPADSTAIIYDDKSASELRLLHLPINLKMKDGRLECYLDGKNVGKLATATEGLEKLCKNNFGDHWEEFVIPLEDEKGQYSFILLPYKQSFDPMKKAVVADQSHVLEGVTPSLLTLNSDGTLQSTLKASLYLANHLLMQANHSKDPDQVRAYHIQAEKLIAKISQEKIPQEEQKAFLAFLKEMENQLPISLSKSPSRSQLSLTLKLRLQMHRLQQGIETSFGIGLPPKDKFAALEQTFKLTQAYLNTQSSKKEVTTPAQFLRSSFDLTPEEHSQLLDTTSVFMKELVSTSAITPSFAISTPNDVSPEFLLTLVRSAKAPSVTGNAALDTAFIKNHEGPFTVEELIQNFWTYFITIKNQKLSPSDLLIFMQPSILPPNISVEEKERLQAIDLQARQFLLALSKLQTALEKDPKTTIQESIEEAKKEFNSSLNDPAHKDMLDKMRENFHPLVPLLDRLSNEMDNLKVKTVTKKIEGKEIEVIDIKDLSLQLNREQTTIHNITSELFKTKEAAKLLLEDLRKAQGDLESEKDSLEKQIRSTTLAITHVKDEADKDDLLAQKAEFEQKLEEVKEQIDTLKNEKVTDPISHKEVSKKHILKNLTGYQNTIQTLENLWSTTKNQGEELSKFIENAEGAEQAITQLALMDNLIEQIQSGNLKTDPNFKLPSGEAERALFLTLMQEIKKNPHVTDNPKALLKKIVSELGVRKGLKFSWDLYKLQSSGIQDKILQFTQILAGVAVASDKLIESHTIEITPASTKPSSINVPEGIDRKIHQYLNEDEIELLKTKMASLKEDEKKTFITQLASVLDVTEKIASNIMQTSNAIQSINANAQKIQAKAEPTVLSHVEFPESAKLEGLPADKLENTTSLFPSIIKGKNIKNILEVFVQKDKTADEMLAELSPSLWTKENMPLILAIKEMREDLGRKAIQELYKIGLQNLDQLKGKFESSYQQWQKDHHEKLVKKLKDETVPDSSESKDSQYSEDLKTALDNLKENNPLASPTVVNSEGLGLLTKNVNALIKDKTAKLQTLENTILQSIKDAPFDKLPKELQQLRALKASDQEILQQALYLSSLNKLSNTPELETALLSYCTESASLKTLNAGQNNALTSIARLDELSKKRETLSKPDQLTEKRLEQIKQLEIVESEWKSESARLLDILGRCQKTEALEDLPELLKPHLRTIAYLQHHLGIVLRKDQLENIDLALRQGATVLTLLMGAGKTSTLMPFLLAISLQMGHNVIGVLPREQFDADMKKLDETTRCILEYAAQEFLFSRDNLKLPINDASLAIVAQKCAAFLDACANNKKYNLTTAESKASLDDKIAEIEIHLERLLESANALDPDKDSEKRNELFSQITKTQIALEMLLQVQGVFENKMTKVLTDEIDYILRSNYSINAEMGKKSPPPPALTQPVHQIFTIIRDSDNPALKNLNALLASNEQITLNDKTKVDPILQAIGREWMEKYGEALPASWKEAGTEENKVIMDWIVGGPYPDDLFAKIDSVNADQLFTLRAALHQALRTCIGLKIGLNTNFDPTYSALGVPATQGAVNATTKFSDILMQLSVSQMIANYKPQGEDFIAGALPKALTTMKAIKSELEKDLAEHPQKTWLTKEIELYETTIERLTMFMKEKEENQTEIQSRLVGNEPWKMLARQILSEELVSNNIVYTSSTQVQRPVQAAFWGCNLIGLTGTATRNVSHLVTATGCETAMDNVTKTGKNSTAEVIYRVAASLPQGLDTPVGTYPSSPEGQLNLFLSKAKDKKERFLFNQAGLCDNISPQKLVEKLHTESKRPIIHIDVSSKQKSVWINNELKRLDTLTKKEKQEVEDNGFFYYHTQHTRGTDFLIPVGSEGSTFFSPTVNANDRDQTFFRARKIGVGHIVKPYISEQDSDTLKKENGLQDNVQLKHMLKKNHEQTYHDEANEAKDAYLIRISAPLVKAADRLRRRVYADKPITSPAANRGRNDAAVKAAINESTIKSQVTQAFQAMYVNDSSYTSYMNNVRSQGKKGLPVDTSDYLEMQIANKQTKLLEIQTNLTSSLFKHPPFKENEALQNSFKGKLQTINNEQDKIDSLKTIEELKKDFPALQSYPLSIFLAGFEELINAKNGLLEEASRIQEKKEEIKSELPPKTTIAGQSNQTSETEAEAEAQQEQETESADTTAEANREKNGRKLFKAIDPEIFSTVDHKEGLDFRRIIGTIFNIDYNGQLFSVGENLWSERCVISNRLAQQIEHNPLNLNNVAILAAENNEGKLRIVLCDLNSESKALLGRDITLIFNQDVTPIEERSNPISAPINYTVFKPASSPNGELQLLPLGSAHAMKGLEEEVTDDTDNPDFIRYQAEIFIALLHVGFNNLTEDQYKTTAKYFNSLDEATQKAITDSLKAKLGKINPTLYQRVIEKLTKQPEVRQAQPTTFKLK